MDTLFLMLEALLTALALSVDSFVVGFSYGAGKVRIPLPSLFLIDGIGSAGIGLMLLSGSAARHAIPPRICTLICFAVLFVLGLIKLADGLAKAPGEAGLGHNRTLTLKEAVPLALTLAADGCVIGFGAALGNADGRAVLILSVLVQFIMLVGGTALGGRLARRLKCNISWAGGILLIILAFSKLFFS